MYIDRPTGKYNNSIRNTGDNNNNINAIQVHVHVIRKLAQKENVPAQAEYAVVNNRMS